MNAAPSADDVLQRAVARTQQDQARAGQFGYTYTKVNVTEEFDGTGKVKEHKEKVCQEEFEVARADVRLRSEVELLAGSLGALRNSPSR